MELQETLPTQDPIKQGFAGAFALHAVLLVLIFAGGYLFRHHGNEWGAGLDAHAIQATAVSAIPLPSDQPVNDNVLATETPSAAPVTAPKAIAKPDDNAIPIADKLAKTKKADRNAPPPPKYKQQVQTPNNKAQYGEQGGMRVAVASVSNNSGTLQAYTADSSFGTRFQWYVEVMSGRISQNWYKSEADPSQAVGKQVTVTFDILRDGTIGNLRLEKSSGVGSLDMSAMHALQRIDNLAPLPNDYSGSRVNVEFVFTYAK